VGQFSEAGTEPLTRSFAEFYRAEFPAIALIAGVTAGSRVDGEDLAQEAMTRAEQRWETVAATDKPGAWVRRVAINLALNRRRSIGREARAVFRLGKQTDAGSTDDYRLGNPLVWDAIGKLAPRQRAVITLHYFEDRSVNEIAELLDCSVSAATSNLHKARTRLRELLGGNQ